MYDCAHVAYDQVYAHHQRLTEDLKLVNEDLVASASASLPKPPTLVEPSQLAHALLNAGIGDHEGESNDGKLRRKRASHSSAGDTARSTPSTHAGRTTAAVRGSSSNADGSEVRGGKADAADRTVDVEEERDENLYCFCQRASFGEMIGCDSDDCKYEWFHIGCVGVSKPLPQMWVCSDCLAKNKKRRRT